MVYRRLFKLCHYKHRHGIVSVSSEEELATLLLSSKSGIDLNSVATTVIYTVPTGSSLIPLNIVMRSITGTTNAVHFSCGFNSASYDDLLQKTHPAVNPGEFWAWDTTQDSPGTPVIGTEGQTLRINVTTPEGSAATCTIDVLGYTF